MLGLRRAGSNKAISSIIVSLFLIIIAIMAILIVWAVTRNLVSKSPEFGCIDISNQLSIGKACYLNNEEVKVIITRGFDEMQIEKLRLSFLSSDSNNSIWEITGKKCLDIRVGGRYGGYCNIVSEGNTYSYVFNMSGLQNYEKVRLAAGIKDNLCFIEDKEIQGNC